jgi:hypothetical protein
VSFEEYPSEFAGLPVLDFPTAPGQPVPEVEPDARECPSRGPDAVLARLEELDLSLGALGDEGAAALLAGQPLTHLKRLDLHHHFMSEDMMQRLWAALPGVEVNLDEQEVPRTWRRQGPDGPGELESWRYVAVSE